MKEAVPVLKGKGTDQEKSEPEPVKPKWVMVNTPYCQDICERFLGFSLPQDNQLVIISYEGIHIIHLQTPEDVQNDYSYPEGGHIYDHEKQILEYTGKAFQILGVNGGKPILYSQFGEHILLTSHHTNLKDQQRVVQACKVQGDKGHILFEYQFEDMSGDWTYCSFSADSNYIVFGAPYDFFLFQRVQETKSYSG